MTSRRTNSSFQDYLASTYHVRDDQERLPSLNELGQQLGMSVARLREQMEVARALGFVEAKPRTGLRRLPYSFLPAVKQSLSYAIELDPDYFTQFFDLRRNLEAAYWHQAARLLIAEDRDRLRNLINQAWAKLRGSPIQIPQVEHRELHLTIYRRLENPFVLGILEAYWDAYEAVGMNLYADYFYLEEVWGYHQAIVDAICTGDFDAGYQALLKHADLIHHRAITTEEGKTLVTHSA